MGDDLPGQSGHTTKELVLSEVPRTTEGVLMVRPLSVVPPPEGAMAPEVTVNMAEHGSLDRHLAKETGPAVVPEMEVVTEDPSTSSPGGC